MLDAIAATPSVALDFLKLLEREASKPTRSDREIASAQAIARIVVRIAAGEDPLTAMRELAGPDLEGEDEPEADLARRDHNGLTSETGATWQGNGNQ